MHYHLEIILPPVDDVEQAVEQILKPFDENGKDEDGDPNRHGFWDFYVIGGRWSGVKLEVMLDPERLQVFHAELKNRKVTVSGLQFGKLTLDPGSQVAMVNSLWNEYFPESPVKVCPLFSHFNDQYKHSARFPDVMRLKDMPGSLKASRVIIAGPKWNNEGFLAAEYMLQDSFWNGVTWVDSRWDGKVQTAIDEHNDRLKSAAPEYVARYVPKDDWLVVTVDYHS